MQSKNMILVWPFPAASAKRSKWWE